MYRYALLRILGTVPGLLALTLVVFLLMHLVPGDPARLAAGMEASDEAVAALRHKMYLDRPLPDQFAHYLGNLAHGDLGGSFATNQPVAQELARRWPVTLRLALLALVLACLLGILLGVVAAVRRGGLLDAFASVIAVAGISMPVFWLGLLLIYYLSVRLHWFPSQGLASWQGYVLPTVTLVAYPLALIARMTRAGMLEVLGQDYVRTARAKGLPERLVIYRHALRNAMIPTATVIGLSLGFLVGGTVMTESVFNIDGLGRWIVDGVLARDVPVVQAGAVVVGAGFLIANLLVDLSYGWLDPRIRYQ